MTSQNLYDQGKYEEGIIKLKELLKTTANP